ncbi:MAG: sulfotransferase, partial [Bacteroidales bacterium]|nr:sulfotransferase [Bacteroidales bacterium]
QRLFAQDARLRSPQYWEMVYTCPPPEKDTYTTDPRIQKVEKEIDVFYKLCPQFKTIHEVGARLPEECIFLFENDLISDSLNMAFDLPEYYKWLNGQSLRPVYERHKKQLQLLQYRNRGERWVLKAPGHLRSLRSLMQVYPDACIIQTHRDPVETIASATSMGMETLSIFHDKLLPEDVGKKALEWIGFCIDQSMDDREQAESNPNSQVRFFDLYYKDIVADPVGTMRDLYDQCGLAWSSSVEQQMNAFLAENHQHKHGKHQYALEQFGLKEEQINERFASYNKRFFKQ